MESLDSHRYYELKILEHVADRPELPRRVAARKLGVSVKLAHTLLSGLVERGLLHVKKENARRWRYFLTPGGMAEKARLTREFLEFSLEFYREARRRSAQVCRDLSEAGLRRIAFLGLGDLAEIAFLGVYEWGLELVEVFDAQRAGRTFFGCRVLALEAVPEAEAQAIVVTSFDPEHPMTPRWLPEPVQADKRMVWIFGEDLRSSNHADTENGKTVGHRSRRMTAD